jgi:hypothetical protein
VTERARLAAYAKIFKQLPRPAAAQLLAIVATDPELADRQTVIAQAAVLVTAGNRLGWNEEAGS